MIDQVLIGNSLELIENLDENSIDSIITSPPYWGIRNNDIEGQIGWDQSLVQYIFDLVTLFHKARRPLKPEGVVWLNIGEKWASKDIPGLGIKQKDMIGLGWRIAFELQNLGWHLRDCVIWDKKNRCLGGNWTDRTINCHEYIFLLTQQKRYYFDWEAIKEKGSVPAGTRGGKGSESRYSRSEINSRPPSYKVYSGYRRKRSVWGVQPQRGKGHHASTYPVELIKPLVLSSTPPGGTVLDPFAGTGTTGIAARDTGRHYILFEINPEYAEVAKCRLNPPSETSL
jgi:DNA modification methylase